MAHKQRGFYPRWLLTRIEKVLKQTIKVVSDQNTFLHLLIFKASKGHYISRGCEKILEIQERRGVYFRGRFWKILRGGGVMRQIPSVGGVLDIFWNHTL